MASSELHNSGWIYILRQHLQGWSFTVISQLILVLLPQSRRRFHRIFQRVLHNVVASFKVADEWCSPCERHHNSLRQFRPLHNELEARAIGFARKRPKAKNLLFGPEKTYVCGRRTSFGTREDSEWSKPRPSCLRPRMSLFCDGSAVVFVVKNFN